jgi:signal peptidase I
MSGKTISRGKKITPARKIWRLGLLVLGCITLIVPIVAHFGYGIGFSTVLSQSMQPTFSAGDLAITRLIPASTVAVGDVVVLTDPEQSVKYSHRVVTIADTSGTLALTTRGDANPIADRSSVLLPDMVDVSKIVMTLPLLGYVIIFFTSAAALWFGAGLLTLAALLYLLRSLIQSATKPQQKETVI